MACAILGDSLAAGVAMHAPACTADTKIGITSAAYVRLHLHAVDAATVLISLGANDLSGDCDTAAHLLEVRRDVRARRVFWLLPSRPAAVRGTIRATASLFGDRVIETRGATGPDGLHLSSEGYGVVSQVLAYPSAF